MSDLQIPNELRELLAKILFFDIEASGLHRGSYPIELGWATPEFETSSILIKRPAAWTDSDWNFASQEIHGISREILERDGVDHRDAMKAVLEAAEGRFLVSDASEYEEMWLGQLFREAGATKMPRIVDFHGVVGAISRIVGLDLRKAMMLIELPTRVYPHPHRAGPDALGMAAQIRVLYDPEFEEDVRQRNAALGPVEWAE